MRPNCRELLLNEDATMASSSASLRREPELPSAQINSSSPRTPFNPTYNFDSSMAVTIVVLLTALFFMCFFSVYVRRLAEDSAATAELSLRRRQRRGGRPSSTHGLNPSTVNALPLFAYDCIAKDPHDCVVCLTEFEEKETVKIIPRCGHVFHSECIDLWLSSHGSCPLCRSTQFFPSQGDVCLQVFDEMPERALDEDGEGDRASGEEGEEGQLALAVLRRSSSCSSIGKRVPLRRSCSF